MRAVRSRLQSLGVVVLAEGHAATVRELQPAALDERLDLRLESGPGCGLAGRLCDRATGKPLPDVSLPVPSALILARRFVS